MHPLRTNCIKARISDCESLVFADGDEAPDAEAEADGDDGSEEDDEDDDDGSEISGGDGAGAWPAAERAIADV